MKRERADWLSNEETTYGFKWGHTEVQRCMSDKTQGWAVVSLESPTDRIEVLISPTGKMRPFRCSRSSNVMLQHELFQKDKQ